ncbi:hypothetical protein [Streptomyces hyaluromycini]|uniref:hypothetical protein n=1 Tax=Streptomyces hyaluromycini TaxID=1377993 RepID=UPI003D9E0A96
MSVRRCGRRRPRSSPRTGLFDGAARVLFATWQAYALGHGAPRLLWPFLTVEAAFGLAQLWPGWWTRRTGHGLASHPIGRRAGAHGCDTP